jgi:hypothetical protein
VFAGVDYADVLEKAAAEADVILWDGGPMRPCAHAVASAGRPIASAAANPSNAISISSLLESRIPPG